MPNPNDLARMEEELNGGCVMGDIDAQAIVGLERMLDELHATSERMIASFRKRIQDLELENQRYRAALMRYANEGNWSWPIHQGGVDNGWKIAQDALKGE